MRMRNRNIAIRTYVRPRMHMHRAGTGNTHTLLTPFDSRKWGIHTGMKKTCTHVVRFILMCLLWKSPNSIALILTDRAAVMFLNME